MSPGRSCPKSPVAGSINDSDWRGELLKGDKRWVYGVPPAGYANYAWVQHFIHHLAPTRLAGFVLANRYHLYRVFRFSSDARLYTLRGAMSATCRLQPTQYRARAIAPG